VASKYISVFVPVFNGEKYLGELIDSVLHQKLPKGYKLDFIIIDSGSSDSSVSIIKAYGNLIRFSEIPNSEYGHGKTRQKAAEMAKGEIIAYLSQDATPTSHSWLRNLIEPFFLSEKIGCVFGRQIPRPFAVPTIKREVSSVFNQLGHPASYGIFPHISLIDGSVIGVADSFFSDVNSAVRVSLLQSTIPFRDVAYAEDQGLAEDMQKQGYLKVYSGGGSVWHSNEYTAKEYFHRKYDEYLGLLNSTSKKIERSKKELLIGWIKPTVKDISFSLSDNEYNLRAKLKFILKAPIYNIGAQRGKYLAIKTANNSSAHKRYSLESRRK
jgi:rhamnosyltransferase